ncbi:MAG TPA: pitrilysin family protein [Phycisphaerales bacterium]|nr:pitrilysin family protein [Phycisphaerales bacterium]
MRSTSALAATLLTTLSGTVIGLALPAAFTAATLIPAPVLCAQEVKFEKYRLSNGMTVILHEDHSLPVATVNTWYRVGAQDEPPGRSGFAHLFEHLMFMGTHRVPGNQFDVLMETGGGANNASTDLHRTNYFSWGPSKLLPTLLWLDADRLEDMGLEMTQEKLDKQRDVVRNELRQTVENAPYGKASEAVFKLLFTPDHPYYYGVIGTHQDLEAATVTNVKDFFATFYVPSNASLVVAGDFKSDEIKPLIEKLFASIPGGQPVTRKYQPPAAAIPNSLAGVKRFTAIDAVELPKVEFSYHSPVAFGEGDAEMQLAASVLADGKSSRLYRRLVMEEKLAVEVSAMQQGYPLGGIFQVTVLARPEADLRRVEAIMDEELGRFIMKGPTSEELDRQKAVLELSALESIQSIERKADKLNEYEYYWGDPDGFERDLNRFRKASTRDVRAWAEKTLLPDKRVVVNVLPEEPARAESGRDQRPADAAQGPFTLPAPETFTLASGVKVHVWNQPALPMVAVHMIAQPGGALDASGRQGAASLAAQMLAEGTTELDALAFENAVQSIGASFATDADHETVHASMTVLKRSLDRGLDLFADAVSTPRMDASDFDRVKSLTLEALRQAAQVPASIASTVGDVLVYAPGSPYATPAQGTVETVEKLTLDQVRATYAQAIRPDAATILIAGDITPDEARRSLERAFGEWKPADSKAAARVAQNSFTGRDGLHIAVVDRPGATQTYIRFVAPATAYADASRPQRRLLSTLLGGSFTSRLNQNLREDHGYTYGARSRYDMGLSGGTFTAGASVQAEVTGAAITEFMNEFNRLRGGDVTDLEAGKVRETVRNETVRSFQGLEGMLSAVVAPLTSGLPFTTLAQDLEAINSISAADLNSLARTAIPIESGVLVLVGDQQLILEQLKGLKLPAPTLYDAQGKPVETR